MNYTKINILFIFAYFAIPLLILEYGNLDYTMFANIINNKSKSIVQTLIITTFILYLFVIWVLNKTLAVKINYAIDQIKLANTNWAYLLLKTSIILLFMYFIYLKLNITSEMTRDEMFKLIDNKWYNPIIQLIIKFGTLSSVISLIKDKRKLVYTFIVLMAAITFSTHSRSLLILILIPLMPFLKIPFKWGVTSLILIFFSRMIFTGNLYFSWGWWSVYGFGEMLGVLFGPFALLNHDVNYDLYDQFCLGLNAIPGLSLLTYIPIMLGLPKIPELAIYVNDIVKKEYGIFGVASTPYTDILISPTTFIISLLILFVVYIILVRNKNPFLLISAYIAFGFAITSFYRWSFSGATYTFVRDFILFTIVFLILKRVKSRGKGSYKHY